MGGGGHGAPICRAAGCLGVRARIGRPARSPGRGSRLAVARPGEAGETELAGGPRLSAGAGACGGCGGRRRRVGPRCQRGGGEHAGGRGTGLSGTQCWRCWAGGARRWASAGVRSGASGPCAGEGAEPARASGTGRAGLTGPRAPVWAARRVGRGLRKREGEGWAGRVGLVGSRDGVWVGSSLFSFFFLPLSYF